MEYVKIKDIKSNKLFILAKSRISQLYPIMNNKKKWKPDMAKQLYEIKENYTNKDLVGKNILPSLISFKMTPTLPNTGGFYPITTSPMTPVRVLRNSQMWRRTFLHR